METELCRNAIPKLCRECITSVELGSNHETTNYESGSLYQSPYSVYTCLSPPGDLQHRVTLSYEPAGYGSVEVQSINIAVATFSPAASNCMTVLVN